ncbi:nuclear protein MDM1-like [Xenia sp. Carnegie-2017]|uniref:nuclear protein MDM1-like n=1 Tax=Xenia sp. Carnegie-2017 TaxID=2897299 RepID=UPI001F04D71E|nr:nuclear protein MDM1-like [Xenia sp. Carnegie-2017]
MPSRVKRVRFETEYNSSFKAFEPDIYKSPLAIYEPVKIRKNAEENGATESFEPPKSTNFNVPISQTKPKSDKRKDGKIITETRDMKKNNRALKYKAGLLAKTTQDDSKFPLSEYQRQYEWKKLAVDVSPLLNAEKMIFESHMTNIPRTARDKISHKTEYQSKYQNKRAFNEDKDRQEDGRESSIVNEYPNKEMKRLLNSSQNPHSPFFPHGSSNREMHSEYQANFVSPKKYRYEEGIWVGASPAHLLTQNQSHLESSECITNWFEEVMELREKARYYKTRAIEGNYFSREYLAQLDAEVEKLHVAMSEEHEQSSVSSGDDGNDKILKTNDKDRPRVKVAWHKNESKETLSDDAKTIYRNLDEQFENESSVSDSTLLSHEETSPGSRNKKGKNENDKKRDVGNEKYEMPKNENDLGENENGKKKNRKKHEFGIEDENQQNGIEHGENQKGKDQKSKNQDEGNKDELMFSHEKSPKEIKTLNIKHTSKNGKLNRKDRKILRKPAVNDSNNFEEKDKPRKTSKTLPKDLESKKLRDNTKHFQTNSPDGSEHLSSMGSLKGKTTNIVKTLSKSNKKQNNKSFGSLNETTKKMASNELQYTSSGSEASCELSIENTRLNDAYYSNKIHNIHSNHHKSPTSSVRSIYGSDTLKEIYDDSYLSSSSIASRESIAKHTLAHAKQRQKSFW